MRVNVRIAGVISILYVILPYGEVVFTWRLPRRRSQCEQVYRNVFLGRQRAKQGIFQGQRGRNTHTNL